MITLTRQVKLFCYQIVKERLGCCLISGAIIAWNRFYCQAFIFS